MSMIYIDEWSYENSKCFTNIYDPDGTCVICLSWKATEREVVAAINAYQAGMSAGRRQGEAAARLAIRRALGFSDTVLP
jgi:hypothetical protein